MSRDLGRSGERVKGSVEGGGNSRGRERRLGARGLRIRIQLKEGAQGHTQGTELW